MSNETTSGASRAELHAQIRRLGPWFHNVHLAGGVETVPDHPLGDFPSLKWRVLAPHIPADLRGARALDIGCNAGFYSFELAKRGAHVVAIDTDPHYLSQASWAAAQLGLQNRIELRHASVYDLARSDQRFDLVLFMGVFYHLRHPLLALDLVASRVEHTLVFQTLTLPGQQTVPIPADMGLMEREPLCQEGWPRMAFIERCLAGDPTNWWAANHAAVLALLRSSGMAVHAQPGHEIYVCRPDPQRDRLGAELAAQELREIFGSA